MQNRGMFLLGAILVGLGILFFIGSVFHIDVIALCCPVGLIFIGVFVLLRPSLSGMRRITDLRFVGEVKRGGSWQVRDAEYLAFVGEYDFDLTGAEILAGETHLAVNGFVTNVDLRVPPDVGLTVQANGFVTNLRVLDHEEENIASPAEYTTPNYAEAARRINLKLSGFVIELKVL